MLGELTNTGIQRTLTMVTLICRSEYEDTLSERIQLGLRKSSNWREGGLPFNPVKITLVAFTRNDNPPHLSTIRLRDIEV